MKRAPKLLPKNLTLLELTLEDLEVLLDDERGIISIVIDAHRPADLAQALESSHSAPDYDSTHSKGIGTLDKRPDEPVCLGVGGHTSHFLTGPSSTPQDENHSGSGEKNPSDIGGKNPADIGGKNPANIGDGNHSDSGDTIHSGAGAIPASEASDVTGSSHQHSAPTQLNDPKSIPSENSPDEQHEPSHSIEHQTTLDNYADSTHNLTVEACLSSDTHSTKPPDSSSNPTFSIFTDHELCLYFVEGYRRQPKDPGPDAAFFFLDTSDLPDWQGILRYLHWEQHGLNSMGDE